MLKNRMNTKVKILLLGLLALIAIPVVVSAATETKYIISDYNEYYKLAGIGGTGLPFDLFEIVRALFRFIYVFAGQISGQNMFIGIIVGTIIIKLLTLKLSPSGAKPKANLSPEDKAEFDRIKEAQKLYFKKNAHDSDLMRMKSSYDQALNKKFNPALAAVGATGQKWYVTVGSFIILFIVYQALQFGGTVVDGQQYSTPVTLMSATPEQFGTFANLSVNEAMSVSNQIHLIIGILYVVLSALQQYLMAKRANPEFSLRKKPGAEVDQQMMTQKIMMFFTPLLFLLFMFNGQWVFGMVLYFITSSIFDILKLVITDFISRKKDENTVENTVENI